MTSDLSLPNLNPEPVFCAPRGAPSRGRRRTMRVNEPITAHEVEVPEGEPLVSRTDRGRTIVFANHVFVEMSGFTEQELIGSPHNIVRHPLMPQEAFANLWATIKAGRPWDGLVKNRAKTGDFYWVQANVTPEIENGEVTGYNIDPLAADAPADRPRRPRLRRHPCRQ